MNIGLAVARSGLGCDSCNSDATRTITTEQADINLCEPCLKALAAMMPRLDKNELEVLRRTE